MAKGYSEKNNKEKRKPHVNLSCDGFEELLNAKSAPEKLFWCFILTASFSLLLYGWVNLAYRFFYNSAASHSSTHHSPSLSSPGIAICSTIPLNVTKLLENGINSEMLPIIHWHFTERSYERILGAYLKETITGHMEWDKDEDNDTFDVENWGVFVQEYGIECNELLLACSINYDSFFNCCQHAKKIIHENLGTCFVMENLQIGAEGSQGGLVILAKSQRASMIPKGLHGNNMLPFENGLVLEYAANYVPPYTYGAHDQILLAPGTTTYVALSMRKYERYVDCSFNAIPGLSNGGCGKACYNEGVEQFCNCTLLGFHDIDENITFCSPPETLACYGIHGSPNSQDLNRYAYLCTQKVCKQHCAETAISHTLSVAPLQVDMLRRARSDPFSDGGYIKLHLYYPQLMYTLLQEFSIVTWDSILGSVGGQMGLYLGASLITFVQLLVLGFSYFKKILC